MFYMDAEELYWKVWQRARRAVAKKYPPAKPGVFLMRAKPYVASHASCGVGTV